MTTTVDATSSTAPLSGAGVPRWTRLQVTSLALIALAPVLMLGGGLAWGLDVGEDVGFFAVTSLVPLVGAFLAWRFTGWGKIAGAVVCVLAAMALFWTAFGLAAPNSFFDFVPGLLVVPFAIVGLVSGIAAFRAHRRGDYVPVAGGGERRGQRLAIGIVAVLAIVSAVATITSRETVDDTSNVALTVEASDFEFDQETYTVNGGSTILVKNKDPFLHTFTVEALDIDVTLSPGSEKLVEIPAQAGEFIAYCEPHTGHPDDPSDDDMAAQLEVR